MGPPSWDNGVVTDTDLAVLSVSLSERLRSEGLLMSHERAGRFVGAVQLINPVSVEELYWTARVTFVTRREDLAAFDRVFRQIFRGLADTADHRGDTAAPQIPHVRPGDPAPAPAGRRPVTTHQGGRSTSTLRPGLAPTPDGEAGRREIGLASREERLATTDFGDLDELELMELRTLMRQMRISPPLRPGRRQRRRPHGDRLDLRVTLQRSRGTGGDPVVQIWRRALARPRRVVVLCDISGSMEPYARAYLQFLHATTGACRAEVFAFATRLTRLTRALAVVQPAEALARAAAAAPDWHGGTRIGEAIKSFLDGYGRRGWARGAVVVILSDGWECGDAAQLADQMARLRRLAYRVVWVNPRTADPRYQPLAGGMAAALPYCDTVVSGHDVVAMRDVAAAIAASR
jgi:uncharacterized protein with von Willebrand factor type A (vWA) domain